MTGLLVTAVGAGMTAATALLVQNRADRARREERLAEERRLAAERRLQERHERLHTRQTQYTALNTSARQYLTLLSDLAHVLRRAPGHRAPGAVDDAAGQLNAARTAYRTCYAEVQLSLTTPLLLRTRALNRSLNAVYGTLMRIVHGNARTGDTVGSARLLVAELWDELGELRTLLRADLDRERQGLLSPGR
ncbi:hypothetical protein [Streptomyces sp. NPDC005805]|uniref:hypothetical protein n=1 Tax=Streptomyces sp. NPDC005805 TaxID=3157068 RepID=UPI0033C092C4